MARPDDPQAVLRAWTQREDDELLYDADQWDAQHAGPVEDPPAPSQDAASPCAVAQAFLEQHGARCTGVPPADASRMTAAEVAQRIELMQGLLGPAWSQPAAEED